MARRKNRPARESSESEDEIAPQVRRKKIYQQENTPNQTTKKAKQRINNSTLDNSPKAALVNLRLGSSMDNFWLNGVKGIEESVLEFYETYGEDAETVVEDHEYDESDYLESDEGEETESSFAIDTSIMRIEPAIDRQISMRVEPAKNRRTTLHINNPLTAAAPKPKKKNVGTSLLALEPSEPILARRHSLPRQCRLNKTYNYRC